jgi:hypothetical protein
MSKVNPAFVFGRCSRDLQAALRYPLWHLQGLPAPDNHVYKKRCIKSLAQEHRCHTLVETGTFYRCDSLVAHP